MSDASSTYRGYRKQCLYVLWRILCDTHNDDLVYVPEDIEDLAVYKRNNSDTIFERKKYLQELIQVKDLTNPLTLSDFNPQKQDSFFYRVNEALQNDPIKIIISSYGIIGNELSNAFIDDDTETLKKLATKISCYGKVNIDQAKRLLEQIEIEELDEIKVNEDLFNILSEGPTSPDPYITLDLLMKWIYDASEKRLQISKELVLEKINSIGAFLAERSAHYREWETTITQLKYSSADELDHKELLDGYLLGMDARIDHIISNCDIIREPFLKQIAQEFSSENILIIHGASGQGKSSLAYRYIYNNYPCYTCFEIQNINDSKHAFSIVKALSGYASRGINFVIYLDIKQNTRDWSILLRELSNYSNIKILVTVREEDYQIENPAKTSFKFKDIYLTFTKTEAEEIYNSFLNSNRISDDIISFNDAWSKFKENGPLLEFIYLISHGGLLKDRLEMQISRIQAEIYSDKRPDKEIELLKYVSIASAFGAKCKYELLEFLQYPSNPLELRRLEKEYLIRVYSDKLSGLHHIRSEIIKNILCANEKDLANTISKLVNYINPENIYQFLLYAFYYCPNYTDSIINSLIHYPKDDWYTLSLICDAILWTGIYEYVKENNELINDIFKKFNKGVLILVDFDIGRVQAEIPTKTNIVEFVKEHYKNNKEICAEIDSYKKRQTQIINVYDILKKWLINYKFILSAPVTNQDWKGLGKLCFWAGKLDIRIDLPNKLTEIFHSKIHELSIESIADFCIGIYTYSTDIYNEILRISKNDIIDIFKQQTRTVKYIEDSQNIDIGYIISLSDLNSNNNTEDRNYINDESVYRIELLRKIFPINQVFSAKAYGHNLLFLFDSLTHEPSEKHMPLENILLNWEVELNSIFRNLIEYEFRPHDWKEFIEKLEEYRTRIIQIAKILFAFCQKFFTAKIYTPKLIENISTRTWENLVKKDNNFALPKCAVDLWGFASETNSKKSYSDRNNNSLPKEYLDFIDSLNKNTTAFDNFTNQTEGAFITALDCRFSEVMEKLFNEEQIKKHYDKARLSLINLKDFLRSSDDYNFAFSNLFKERFELQNICIEANTRQELFLLWYNLINNPEKNIANPMSFCRNYSFIQNEILKDLKSFAKKNKTQRINIELKEDKNLRTLWFIIDGDNFIDISKQMILFLQKLNKYFIKKYPLNTLKYYILSIYCSEISIIRTINNYLLLPEVVTFDLNSLILKHISDEINILNIKPLNPIAIEVLELKCVNNNESQWAIDFIKANSEFYAFLTHLTDISKFEDFNEESISFEVATEYLSYLKDQKNYLQNLFDSGAKVLEICNSYENKNEDIINAINLLVEWHEIGIKPYAEVQDSDFVERNIPLEEFNGWAIAYKEAFEKANIAALLIIQNTVTKKSNIKASNSKL